MGQWNIGLVRIFFQNILVWRGSNTEESFCSSTTTTTTKSTKWKLFWKLQFFELKTFANTDFIPKSYFLIDKNRFNTAPAASHYTYLIV